MIDVSIIIPTYNRRDMVSQAIDSCLSQANGNRLKLQIVVVDDCSTDRTRDLPALRREEVEPVFLAANAGQSNARNAGVRKAHGTYLKFLDSDDVLEEASLSREVSMAEIDKADVVVSGWGTARFDDQGCMIAGTENRWRAPDMAPLPDSVILGRAVPTSSALYRRNYIAGLE